MRVSIFVWVLLLLSGCTFPSVQDLEEKGIKRSFALRGEQQDIAACVTRVLDAEPWSLSDLPLPVSRVLPLPGGKGAELVSSNPVSPSVLNWRAVIHQKNADVVEIELTARRDVNPYLSGTYAINKVQKAFSGCEKP